MRRAIFLAFLLASSGIAVAQNTKVEVKVTPDGAKVAEPGTQIFTVIEQKPEFPGGDEALYQFLAASQIFTVIEQKPEFPGGDEALYQFLAANLKYPCTDCECSGKVYITFVIEKDGSVSNAKVLRDPCPDHGFGEEALRVVNLMPKWKPGRQHGNPERVQYNLPINFSLK